MLLTHWDAGQGDAWSSSRTEDRCAQMRFAWWAHRKCSQWLAWQSSGSHTRGRLPGPGPGCLLPIAQEYPWFEACCEGLCHQQDMQQIFAKEWLTNRQAKMDYQLPSVSMILGWSVLRKPPWSSFRWWVVNIKLFLTCNWARWKQSMRSGSMEICWDHKHILWFISWS